MKRITLAIVAGCRRPASPRLRSRRHRPRRRRVRPPRRRHAGARAASAPAIAPDRARRIDIDAHRQRRDARPSAARDRRARSRHGSRTHARGVDAQRARWRASRARSQSRRDRDAAREAPSVARWRRAVARDARRDVALHADGAPIAPMAAHRADGRRWRRCAADGADRADRVRPDRATASPARAVDSGRSGGLALPPRARRAQPRRLRPRGADVHGHRSRTTRSRPTRTSSQYFEALARYKIGTTDELQHAAKILEPLASKLIGTVARRTTARGQRDVLRSTAAARATTTSSALYARINGALAQRGDRDAADEGREGRAEPGERRATARTSRCAPKR